MMTYKHWATPVYIGAMVLGILISTAPPFIIETVKKRSWIMAHPDDVLVDVEGLSLGPLELDNREAHGNGADERDDAGFDADRHDRMPPA